MTRTRFLLLQNSLLEFTPNQTIFTKNWQIRPNLWPNSPQVSIGAFQRCNKNWAPVSLDARASSSLENRYDKIHFAGVAKDREDPIFIPQISLPS